MGLPIVTALSGLGTGLGADRAVHARRRYPQLLIRAGGDDRARRGDRLRAVHPHALSRGLRDARIDVPDSRESVVRAIDTAGRAVLFAGSTVVIALLGMMLLGVDFLYGVAISALHRRAAGDARLADAAAGAVDARRWTGAPPAVAARGARSAPRRRPRESADACSGGQWRAWAAAAVAALERVRAAPALDDRGRRATLVMLLIAAPAIALRLGSSDAQTTRPTRPPTGHMSCSRRASAKASTGRCWSWRRCRRSRSGVTDRTAEPRR